MSNNTAIEVLQLKRELLITQRNKAIEEFDNQISNLETAIEELSGKKVWETERVNTYDDESPDYIKSSQEEI
jgi:hypothetical protein